MEKWSRYNYILNSNTIGKFIYNSRTNSFTRINDALFNSFNNDKIDLNLLNNNTISKLKELKIIVNDKDDDEYYYMKKYITYLNIFNKSTLSLTIATTSNCNFRCPYCYEDTTKKMNSNNKINDAIIRFIDNNKAENVNITWYGGEPLLNFKSIEYLSDRLKNNYNNKHIRYSLITNGYLLTPKIVSLFIKYNLSEVQITIDGLKDTNDKTRILANGEGSFDVIIKNLEYAIDKLPKCLFTIRVNVGENNIDEYPTLYNFILDKFSNYNNITCYHSYIKDYGRYRNYCVAQKEEFNHNKSFVEKFGITNGITLYPHFSVGGCCAQSDNSFVINPDGSLCKCWVDIGKENRIIGSLLTNSDHIINHHLLSQYIINSDVFSDEKCKNCFLFPVCDGGCPYQRLDNNHTSYCEDKIKNFGKYLELYYNKLNNK